MNRLVLLVFLFVCLYCPFAGQAQYIAVSGGGVFPRDVTGTVQAGTVGGPARAEFSNSGLLSVDGGIGFLPFVGVQLHYALAHPSLFLRRGDALGSTARLDLTANTFALEGRVRPPGVLGFGVYGVFGGGISRFGTELREQVANPFPSGVPDNVIAPVFTYGGGVEKGFFPFLKWKFEIRDEVTRIPEDFFIPGGSWHRPQAVTGIVIGR